MIRILGTAVLLALAALPPAAAQDAVGGAIIGGAIGGIIGGAATGRAGGAIAGAIIGGTAGADRLGSRAAAQLLLVARRLLSPGPGRLHAGRPALLLLTPRG